MRPREVKEAIPPISGDLSRRGIVTLIRVIRRMATEFAGAFGVCVILSLVLLIWDPVRALVERLINFSGDLNALLTGFRDSRRYLWVYLYVSLFVSAVYAVGVGIVVFREGARRPPPPPEENRDKPGGGEG